MITNKISTTKLLTNGLFKFCNIELRKRPRLVNLEVTKRCNARCNFCNYWKEKSERELNDYLPLLKKINPIVVSLTGGEPLLRKDIFDIVKSIKTNIKTLYMALITNGILLDFDKTKKLYECGVDQLTVSLDYLSLEHDRQRGVPGLFEHITSLLPELAMNFDNIYINTVVKNDNFHEIPKIIETAHTWGVKVSLSAYSMSKTKNTSYMIEKEKLPELKKIVGKILELKKKYKNVIASDFYIKNIYNYFEGTIPERCQGGKKWLQVTPDGYLKSCSEAPVKCHWTNYDKHIFLAEDIKCKECWFSCRGESEAPMTLGRIKELAMRF